MPAQPPTTSTSAWPSETLVTPTRISRKLVQPPASSSPVSSPSADQSSSSEVDELLEGIDRVRIDDLWNTPRAPQGLISAHKSAPFRPGLFAPPDHSGSVTLPPAPACAAASAPPPRLRSIPAPRLRSVPAPLAHSRQLNRMHLRHAQDFHCDRDFPRLFKVYACRNRASCVARGETADCFGYHNAEKDRRRANVAAYKPHMCRFIDDPAGCRKGDRCPFAHNDFERRYHPDRFGKETCRDFLRGDCPRSYCTFRHEVSSKVETALAQIDAMNDKEMLQLVLKIAEPRGKALCEKLLRRFGHGKKHSGWKLEGFNPHGRDDQKVKYVTGRVEVVKKLLRDAGEKKWSASLKTSSLRDMMSGVRKLAEEIRERCRGDENYVESGSEVHRLIRAVFSNTNWSCHSQEGDNPFLVTPENQNDALSSLERLVGLMLAKNGNNENIVGEPRRIKKENNSAIIEKQEQATGLALSKKNNITQEAVVDRYMDMVSSGECFGAIGHNRTSESEQVPALWAYPTSVGQLTV